VVHCQVTELDPPRCIAYTWRGGPGPDKPYLLDTAVRFTLQPTHGGTRLLLEHTGFDGFRAVLVSFMLGSGWRKMMHGKLSRIVAAMSRGEGFSGVATHEDCGNLKSRAVGAIVEKLP
jgi:uncharacterized protein YndB with AHSA1/START domain